MGSIKQNLANNILSGGKFDATDLDGTIPNTNINDNSIDNVTSFPAAGSGIPSVASDPPSPSQGDVWYNTTSNAFKYVGATTTGSWATGNNFNSPASSGRGDGTQGTQNASLAVGYFQSTGGTPEYFGGVESYDGTSWTTETALNTTRAFSATFGTNSATITAGGTTPGNVTNTESWNGSAWTELNDLNTARNSFTGAGIATAGVVFGGSPTTGATESWNGTSWTEVNDLNSTRYALGGAGTSTEALAFGGSPEPAGVSITESWNGTSWTEVNDLNSARVYIGGIGPSASSAFAFGGTGAASYLALTEEYNGTSWSELADLSTARYQAGGGGSSSAGIAYGGNVPGGKTQATEEWTGAGTPVTKTVTTA
jgi:hypothetical protein